MTALFDQFQCDAFFVLRQFQALGSVKANFGEIPRSQESVHGEAGNRRADLWRVSRESPPPQTPNGSSDQRNEFRMREDVVRIDFKPVPAQRKAGR